MSRTYGQFAYGLGFRGLPELAELTRSATAGEIPEIEVHDLSGTPMPSIVEALNAETVVRRLADGHVLELHRSPATATLRGAPIEASSWAHPYLAPIATTFNRWHGREGFHAGAFASARHAWVVLGPPTAGKSTLLAALARRGLAVLSDDIAITDGAVVFPGPRCIDLRHRLPHDTTHLPRSRWDTRWRVSLPPLLGAVPLGGWLFLGWGDEVSVRPIEAAELIGRLARRRSWRELPSDPTVLLSLATRPAWDLSRPLSWDRLEETLDLVEATLSAPSAWSTRDTRVRAAT